MPTINAHIAGTVWSVEVDVGDQVGAGDEVVIIESMKMELPVEAEATGTVSKLLCSKGDAVQEGQALIELSLVPAG